MKPPILASHWRDDTLLFAERGFSVTPSWFEMDGESHKVDAITRMRLHKTRPPRLAGWAGVVVSILLLIWLVSRMLMSEASGVLLIALAIGVIFAGFYSFYIAWLKPDRSWLVVHFDEHKHLIRASSTNHRMLENLHKALRMAVDYHRRHDEVRTVGGAVSEGRVSLL